MKVKTANDNVTDRKLDITKILNAPVELVWEAGINPKHIPNWWGQTDLPTQFMQRT